MKKKTAFLLVAAVLLLTAVLAAVHLTTREQVETGRLVVSYQNKQQEVVFAQLPLQQIQGTISNAKGQTFPVDAKGLSAEAFLAALNISGFSKMTVVADDEYRAEVSAAEIAAEDTVALILQEDGGVQMVVFPDSNSKRNVTNVIRVEVS